MTFEFERLGRIPYNEFSEICSGDMITADYAYTSYILDFPEAFKSMQEKEKRLHDKPDE